MSRGGAASAKDRDQWATPDQLTADLLTELCYTWERVERRIRGGNLRDFIGCIDYLAFQPSIGILGVQTTTTSNQAARIAKVLAEPRAKRWLESGGKIQVWGWLFSAREKKWKCTIRSITLGEIERGSAR